MSIILRTRASLLAQQAALDAKADISTVAVLIASGTTTLVGGTKTVATALITANSRVYIAVQSLGTIIVPVAIGASSRSAGVSFTITSQDVTDTSTVVWNLWEPV